MSKFFPNHILEQQPLIEGGIITLPSEITDSAFQEFFPALKFAREWQEEKPIKLYITGFGGAGDIALAICNMIAEDGNVDGYLAGGGYSCHALIWTACNERYCYPYSILGIHGVQLFMHDAMMDINTYQSLSRNAGKINNYFAQMLGNTCGNPDYNAAYWTNLFETVGIGLTKDFTSDEMVNELRIGKYVNRTPISNQTKSTGNGLGAVSSVTQINTDLASF